MIVHCDLSDELLTYLDSRAIATLCSVLRFSKRVCAVLEDEWRWLMLLRLHCGVHRSVDGKGYVPSDGSQDRESESPLVVAPTVKTFGCRALVDFLSLREQLQHLRQNVFVTEGDLGTIKSVHGHTVDCLAFPTSFTFRNPGVGVAARVHERAGPELDMAISARDTSALSWPPASVLCTRGYNSGMTLLAHCAGPSGTMRDRDNLLRKVYTDALRKITDDRGVACAAFASISTGRMAFPVDRAAAIALQAVRDAIYRRQFDTKIAFVCFEKQVYRAFLAAQKEILRTALIGRT